MGKEEREGIKGKRKEREREDRGGIGKKELSEDKKGKRREVSLPQQFSKVGA